MCVSYEASGTKSGFRRGFRGFRSISYGFLVCTHGFRSISYHGMTNSVVLMMHGVLCECQFYSMKWTSAPRVPAVSAVSGRFPTMKRRILLFCMSVLQYEMEFCSAVSCGFRGFWSISYHETHDTQGAGGGELWTVELWNCVTRRQKRHHHHQQRPKKIET